MKNKLVYVLGALLSMGVVSCDLTENLLHSMKWIPILQLRIKPKWR